MCASREAARLVDRGRDPLPVLLSAAALVALLVLSAVPLAARPRRRTERLGRLLERAGPLPELLFAAALLTLLLLLLVGASLSPLTGSPLFAASATGLPASVGLLVPALLPPARRRRFAGNAAALLLGLLLAALTAEAGLRLSVRGGLYHPDLDLRPDLRLVSRCDIPGVSPVCTLTTNRLGLRGDEPPEDWEGAFTILTVGGSTTHCSYIGDGLTWPDLLQDRLRAADDRVWVGNGGLNGHSTRGHLLFMREVVPVLRPDMVVVLCGVNDLVLSLRPDRELSEVDPELAGSFGCRLYHSSRLLQLLTGWKRALFDDLRVREIEFYMHPEPLDRPEDPVPEDPESILVSLPEFRDNVRAIIALSREHDVRIVFLTQPSLIEDKVFWAGLMPPFVEGLPVYSYATRSRLLDAFNRELIAVCDREGVPCFDLAAAMGHDPALFTDEVHFTEAGCAGVAERVADFLLTEGLVPRSPLPPPPP